MCLSLPSFLITGSEGSLGSQLGVDSALSRGDGGSRLAGDVGAGAELAGSHSQACSFCEGRVSHCSLTSVRVITLRWRLNSLSHSRVSISPTS